MKIQLHETERFRAFLEDLIFTVKNSFFKNVETFTARTNAYIMNIQSFTPLTERTVRKKTFTRITRKTFTPIITKTSTPIA